MDYMQLLRTEALQNRGIFASNSIKWAYGLPNMPQLVSEIQWQTIPLEINANGTLLVSKDKVIIHNLHDCGLTLVRDQLIIKLSINSQKVILFKLVDEGEYVRLLSALLVWISLKPPGVFNKWNFATEAKGSDTPLDVIQTKLRMFGPTSATGSVCPIFPKAELNEGWMEVTGVLLNNGTIIVKNDAEEVLYSIDVSALFASEIRIIHSSVVESPNCLFVGVLSDYRDFHNQKDTEICAQFPSATRFLLEFESTSDLQDWYIGMQALAKVEFIGDSLESDSLRISNSTSLEILQAEFSTFGELSESELYAEVDIWGAPWFKTASVKLDKNKQCFWKEIAQLNLSYFKKCVSISIKTDIGQCVGVCAITADLFYEDQILKRLPIVNATGQKVGELLVNLTSTETHILPYKNYKLLEHMFLNMKVSSIVSVLEKKVNTANLKEWSLMLLNIYQSMKLEEKYLNSLLLHDLKPMRVKNKSFNTLFRGNTIFSVSLEEFSNRVGKAYIAELLTEIVTDIENSNLDCDPKTETGYQALLIYCERIWSRIFQTTNDLPEELKSQWRNLRRNVEMSIDPSDSETPLNALCAFVFLRFLCPPILNPKLFNLSKTHLTGNASKTLTMIAKVLMTLGNRSKFQEMKEPHLVQLNVDFIEKHQEEVSVYFDKVTMRKIDFNERKFNIREDVDKCDTNRLGNLPNPDVLNELPIKPFMIDKNLNLTKLVQIVQDSSIGRKLTRRKSYQLDDLLGFEDEEFMNSAIDFDDDEFNQLLITEETSVKELTAQCNSLMKKLKELEGELFKAEKPDDFTKDVTYEDHVTATLRSITLNDKYQVVFDGTGKRLNLGNELRCIMAKAKQQQSQSLARSSSTMSIRKSISLKKLAMQTPQDERTSMENKRRSSLFGKLFNRK